MQIFHLIAFTLLSIIYIYIWDTLSKKFLSRINNKNLHYIIRIIALTICIYISFFIFGAMEMLFLV